jgi:hypothetical protein
MRKSVCILSFALILGAVAAFAQTGSTGTGTTGTGTTTTTTTTTTTHKGHHKGAAAKSAHGSVAAKDDTAKTITVHPKTGSDWTFDTNDSTKYWLSGKAATWADVAVGQNATVTYKVDGDKKWATKVKLSTPKTAPAAK